MAKFNHTVYYRINGSGPTLTANIIAESVDDAESLYQSANPTHRIERVMTTVTSTLN